MFDLKRFRVNVHTPSQMHSKYSEVFSGRIEFLLSPDDRYQPMSQKARQELWRKVQEMLEHIREL